MEAVVFEANRIGGGVERRNKDLVSRSDTRYLWIVCSRAGASWV